ncbi:GNAT family N-acetyltransferase [Roseococcus sp. SYP-B2431]|uniref:GNAT family N-acetyltransferase n=1 Tax=Roseococcus sp. SYP-B2431 TaxID=2496640 RepID=UPI0010408EA9|nr:GNAT family N-acetyltransferase [Roseococcus sp. SYP-B2431]TCH98671.1 GNAT family N-acetyltransferase [Roseococcus sp. SYP-B2431]
MRTSILITDSPSRAETDVILRGLIGFNEAATRTPGDEQKHFAALVRDEGRNTIGGAIGSSYYGWLVIDLLWLPESLRGTGLGTQVMRMAEQEARARGCVGIRLDTFSFQARGFYEKLGFSVFGTLPEHPPGHTRYWLAKRFG